MHTPHALLLSALLAAMPLASLADTPARPVAAAAAADPYGQLRTVHGWATAFRAHGGGTSASSPYYTAAVHKRVVYDAHGNFLDVRYLGATTRIDGTQYVLRHSVAVQGVAVYTYVKA